MKPLYFSLILFLFSYSDAHLCGDHCLHGACCEIRRDEFRCCPYVNGVCCSDTETCCPEGSSCGLESGTCKLVDGTSSAARHLTGSSNACCIDESDCCPSGTTCNHETKRCEAVSQSKVIAIDTFFSGTITAPKAGKSPYLIQQTQKVTMTINQTTGIPTDRQGTICDDKHYACPSETTCCPGTDDSFACCPLPEAVCCPDRLHCCPKGTNCDSKAGRCTSSYSDNIDIPRTTDVVRPAFVVRTNSLCPDQQSSCQDDQTCCQMPSKSWGCCPFPDAVCCSDGLHCCPKGYQCDPKDGECVKKTSAYAVGSGVTCPGAEFGCDNGSTCCPSGNGVWNCCPFEDAICCPDKEHCCPPDTVCDLENHRCVRSTSHRPNQFATSMDSSQHMQGACPGGLVACPHGTCCKDSSGVDACCPYPSAVCCSSGHCCPQDMQCDDTNGLCTPAGVTPQPEKASPHALPKREVSCPDGKSSCEADRTCCSLIDGSFGCCPFANGTCCSDKRHCCPAGSTCTEHGQCVHHLKLSFQRTTLVAEKMVSALSPPAHLTQSPSDTVNSTDVVHATWCGYCANDWFCCPNAKGIRNQMCCPAAAGICCSDGEHCCPRGTRCTGDGHCEDSHDDLVMSLAPYLIAAKSIDGKAPSFIAHLQPHSFNLLIAKETSRARLDPLFLLDFYYYLWHDAVTVCPDRERYCPSDEQCCPSNKHGYTCAPVGATCCSPASETFCPSASTCSHDGLMCDY